MDLRKIQQQEKRKSKGKLAFRSFFVIVGAIVLTSLAVNATDNISGLRDSLLGGAANTLVVEQLPCEEGMSLVSSPGGDFCIDVYEVSAGPGCPYQNPQSAAQTHLNLQDPNCEPVARNGNPPWTHISHNQAISACSKAGKHLPSNQEWFLGSLGTPDKDRGWSRDDCNVSNNWDTNTKGDTGSGSRCVSDAGAYDMIGNVWEWSYETVAQGSYKGFELPEEGFVASVNEEGIPIETDEVPNTLFFEDRFWIDRESHTGIIRGGYWGNGSDGGRYAFHTEIPPSFTGAAVGFRCAK